MPHDLYEILGVTRDATAQEIKKSYRQLALKYHPDKIADDLLREASEATFKEVSAAYEILSDEQKRAEYDEFGTMDGGMFSSGFEDDYGTEDDFMNFFRYGAGRHGGFADTRSSAKQDHWPKRTKDSYVPLKLSTKQLYLGRTFQFQAKRKVLCPRCAGSGLRKRAAQRAAIRCEDCDGQGFKERIFRIGAGLISRERVECKRCEGRGSYVPKSASDKCKKCNGYCTVPEQSQLSVYVPRGSRHGDKIRLHGKSDMEPGMETGDIVFQIEEQTDNDVGLERRGTDLYCSMRISLAEALTGFSKFITRTFDERVLRVTIPMGKVLRPGNYLKFSNEGWPIDDGATFGDLYVKVDIEFPNDDWFNEKSEVESIRNILPGLKSERKSTSQFNTDPANTEDQLSYTIFEGSSMLPSYFSEAEQDRFQNEQQGANDSGTECPIQ
ncbi:HBR019Wp [Eremothecium sinecaudum]|uniref:HBR019Wp n=1 Tax=Eremothecium sinecaudum TaxID=45286 RepID=A0A109UWQ7_9SACH|nr:HBR019Wp [Eremothecium sinecaudum]AMD18920.1 HBR019Wp [Eremothecium sinecaudum]